MGKVKRDWQDVVTVLACFGVGKWALNEYEAFVREGISQGRRPELVGGGHARSSGGWSQVLSLRRRVIKVVSDERILGRDEFVHRLLREAEKREKDTIRLASKVRDFATLARRFAAVGG
jgi:hypothetical protein